MAAGVGGLAVFVLAIKFTIRRQRPPGDWGAIYRNTDPHSFPTDMPLAQFISCNSNWFGACLVRDSSILLGAHGQYGTVFTGVHYLSDIIAGLVLGVAAGLFCGYFSLGHSDFFIYFL